MSSQLFEEDAPPVAAPKNGRSARTVPAPKPESAAKPEIALTDPFADEPETETVVEPAPLLVEPAPILEVAPEPVIAAAPTPVSVPAPAPVAPVVVAAPVAAAAPVATTSTGARALPEARQSLTLTLKTAGCDGLVIVGLYDDGTPGEVLLLLRRASAETASALEAYTATLTLALPYGVPAGALAHQLLSLLGSSEAREAAEAIANALTTRF